MLQVLGTTVENVVTSDQTDGQYYQFAITLPPGEGVPPHVHTDEDELFYVLEGEMTVILDGHEHTAKAGKGFAFPREIMHGFFNRTDHQARALVTVSPGAAFERFFVELDQLSRQPEIDMPQVAALLGRYGMTFAEA